MIITLYKRIDPDPEENWSHAADINYLKRIKKILTDELGKKFKFGKIEKLLTNPESSFEEVRKILVEYNIRQKSIDTIEEYYIGLQGEQANHAPSQKNIAVRLLLSSFGHTMSDREDELHDMDDNTRSEQYRLWGKTPNYLFDNKTPESFVQIYDPEWSMNGITYLIRTEKEADFYRDYSRTFTQEEYEFMDETSHLWWKSDKKVSSIDIDTLKMFCDRWDWLHARHPDFFRVRFNWFSIHINYINKVVDVWQESTDKTFLTRQEAEKMIEFLRSADDHINFIKKFAPDDYEVFSPYKEDAYRTLIVNNLSMLCFYVLPEMDKKCMSEAFESGDEEIVIMYIWERIRDFDKETFLKRAREELSIEMPGDVWTELGDEEDMIRYDMLVALWRLWKHPDDIMVIEEWMFSDLDTFFDFLDEKDELAKIEAWKLFEKLFLFAEKVATLPEICRERIIDTWNENFEITKEQKYILKKFGSDDTTKKKLTRIIEVLES